MATAHIPAPALVEIDVHQWMSSSSGEGKQAHVSGHREVASFSRSGDGTVTVGSRENLRRFKEPKLGTLQTAGFFFHSPNPIG